MPARPERSRRLKRPWVVKAGGELLAAASARRKILADLVNAARSRPVVFVHGGGPQIKKELAKRRIRAAFVGGRRVTSREAMAVVEQTLSGPVNKSVVADLVRLGAAAVGLSGRDGGLITGRVIPKLGRAARPEKINGRMLSALLKGKFLPVVSSVASDTLGQAVNINADDAASAVAVHLKAARLIFLTDVAGVRNGHGKRMGRLSARDVRRLIDGGIITGGMLPKVQSAMAAIKKGVGEVDIVNGFKGMKLDQGTRIIHG